MKWTPPHRRLPSVASVASRRLRERSGEKSAEEIFSGTSNVREMTGRNLLKGNWQSKKRKKVISSNHGSSDEIGRVSRGFESRSSEYFEND